MREVGRNKVNFLSFPLTSCHCYVGVQSICHAVLVISVQLADSGTTYPWSISGLFWVLLTLTLTLTRMSPQDERLLLNHAKTPGFLVPRGEEFNLGPETRLDRSELLCNKVLLKYKGDRESF